MISKIGVLKVQLTILAALFIIVFALLLTVSQNHFNSSEINLLVEQAEEHGLEYEVVIHNQFTNSYSFDAGIKSDD